MLLLHCLCILSIVGLSENQDEFCELGSSSCSSENSFVKSDSKYNIFLNEIRRAFESYEECTANNCSCHFPTLLNDLRPFSKGIYQSDIRNIRSKGTLYQIVDGLVYREKDCMFPARCAGIEHFLLKIAKKLPNTEMVINTRDWPQSSIHYGVAAPVFSFSKNNEYADIMFPAWSFWEGGPAIKTYPTGLGRWDLHRKSLSQKFEEFPWKKKMEVGFFRGSRTSSERDALILLSRKNPELVDAQYTKNQAWKSIEDSLGAEPVPEVTLEDHCKYKYLFNFRGVAASFRFKHLFLCGSLVIHVGNEWLEFFYPTLKPWVHYIPLSSQATEADIKNVLEFVKRNDDVVKDIADRGRQFIIDHLRLKDVTCYWRNLIKRYTKLLKYDVVRSESLNRVF